MFKIHYFSVGICAAVLLVLVTSQECNPKFDFTVKTRDGAYKKTTTYKAYNQTQEMMAPAKGTKNYVSGEGDCSYLVGNGVTPVFTIVECSPPQPGYTINVVYRLTINSLIRCFTLESLGEFGGYADWRYGGVNSKNITVIINSNAGYGLNYLITFY